MPEFKTYSELSKLKTFEERFEYLSYKGNVGKITFGGSRLLNQDFYRSSDWKRARDFVIVRDNGCDLGMIDRPIRGRIIVHHLVCLTKEDFFFKTNFLLNPEYMICVSHKTHNALHYSSDNNLPKGWTPREPNDTCPWR